MSDAARRIAHRAKHGPGKEGRAAAVEERGLAEAMRREQGRSAPAAEPVSKEAIEAWLKMFAAVVGREMSVERHGKDRRLHVVQRCRACRDEVVSPVPDLHGAGWGVDLGALVRGAYHLHLCRPVESDVASLTPEHLDDLTRDTEIEMERIGRRLQALHAAYRPGRTVDG